MEAPPAGRGKRKSHAAAVRTTAVIGGLSDIGERLWYTPIRGEVAVTKKILAVWMVLLLASCAREPAVSLAAVKPDPPILVGRSLEEMGYTVVRLEETRFTNPLLEQAEYPIRCYLLPGGENHQRAQMLEGTYNVISVGMPWDGTGAEMVDLMWLQAFPVEDLSQPEAAVSVAGDTRTPLELEGFLIWRDEAIAVYDVTAFERQTDLDEVISAFRRRLFELHENAVAVLPAQDGTGRKSAFANMDVENYNVEILREINQFLQENIGQMIAKNPPK